LLLEENDIKEYVEMVILDPKDVQELATHKKREVKAKRVKDHLLPHIFEKKTTKDMYDALVGLYQSGNTSRKLTLRHQLRSIEMSSLDTIANYLTRITQIRDHLLAIGEVIVDTELVNVALNGFLGS
jgi:replicative DNA helicase